MLKWTALAKRDLIDFNGGVGNKKAFLAAYSYGISNDPSLIKHEVYKLVVRTLLEENPHHASVRENAAYVVAKMLNHHPEWADNALGEAVKQARGPHSFWAYILNKALEAKRPDLIAGSEAEPALPDKHPVSSPVSTAQPA